MSFEDLGLTLKTIKALTDQDIFTPSEVQQQVIPAVLQGKDVFITSPSGCGKTSSYIFPLIDIVNNKSKRNTILILTPTSKNAIVVSERFVDFSKYHSSNKRYNNKPANVIIASPDLFLEICAQNGVDVRKISILVIDDINEIKKEKKFESLEKSIELLPEEKQTIVYASRKSKDIDNLLKNILKEPLSIRIKTNKKGYFPEPIKTEALKEESPKEETSKTKETKEATKKETKPKNKRKSKKVEKTETKEEAQTFTKINVELNELTKEQLEANSFNGLVPDFMLRTGVISK